MTLIAFDIDDVLYPWYDNAHTWCIKHGLVPEGTPRPNSWAPHEEYKVESEVWYAALDAATEEGNHLYLGGPLPGAVGAVEMAVNAGLEVVFITARGQFKNGERIKQLTEIWLYTHFGHIGHRGLHFTKDKGPLALDLGVSYAIDDSMPNIHSYLKAGIMSALQAQTWNADANWPWRVSNVTEFVERVITLEGGR